MSCSRRLVDEACSPRLFDEALFEAAVALPEVCGFPLQRGVVRVASVVQHARDGQPRQASVEAEDEERLLVWVERGAKLGEAIFDVGTEVGARAAPVAHRHVRHRRQVPPTFGLMRHQSFMPDRGVTGERVEPRAEGTLPAKGSEPAPEVLADLTQHLVSVGFGTEARAEERIDLCAVVLDPGGGGEVEIALIEGVSDPLFDPAAHVPIVGSLRRAQRGTLSSTTSRSGSAAMSSSVNRTVFHALSEKACV